MDRRPNSAPPSADASLKLVHAACSANVWALCLTHRNHWSDLVTVTRPTTCRPGCGWPPAANTGARNTASSNIGVNGAGLSAAPAPNGYSRAQIITG